MTYSIVARDAGTGQLGVGVQSHAVAIGRIVPWARAGVGAVAAQSIPSEIYGARLLAGVAEREDPRTLLEGLLAADEAAGLRQIGVVDGQGGAAAHTGDRCVRYAGHAVRDGVSVQGSVLAADGIWDVMVEAFEATEGQLARRLLAALDAAEGRGGDLRGRQSAALLVVSGDRFENPWEGVLADVRVDDHPDPLPELRRLTGMDAAYRAMLATVGEMLAGDGAPGPAAGRLRDAQEVYGAANLEPSLWEAVALARAGDAGRARQRIDALTRQGAGWGELFERFRDAGFVP